MPVHKLIEHRQIEEAWFSQVFTNLRLCDANATGIQPTTINPLQQEPGHFRRRPTVLEETVLDQIVDPIFRLLVEASFGTSQYGGLVFWLQRATRRVGLG